MVVRPTACCVAGFGLVVPGCGHVADEQVAAFCESGVVFGAHAAGDDDDDDDASADGGDRVRVGRVTALDVLAVDLELSGDLLDEVGVCHGCSVVGVSAGGPVVPGRLPCSCVWARPSRCDWGLVDEA